MKSTVKQLAFVAAALFAIVTILSSFKPTSRNSIANGTGIADGINFSLNAVKQQDGTVVGHIQYGASNYIVNGGEWFGTSAILYTSDGYAFYVYDHKGPVTDWISDPIPAGSGQRFSPSDFYSVHFANNGNIQVKE
ncbi:MAG TPA: hypothetical protein VFH07_08870 [Chitinophagaceae bacterium]|nr:hypothetical protein [Chitinophagaceae bacterium]